MSTVEVVCFTPAFTATPRACWISEGVSRAQASMDDASRVPAARVELDALLHEASKVSPSRIARLGCAREGPAARIVRAVEFPPGMNEVLV